MHYNQGVEDLHSPIYVTGFAKRGFPHTSNIANLMSYNFCSVRASHLKFSHSFFYMLQHVATKVSIFNSFIT